MGRGPVAASSRQRCVAGGGDARRWPVVVGERGREKERALESESEVVGGLGFSAPISSPSLI